MPTKDDLLNDGIHSDVRVARTLPTEYYCDPQYFELAKERIFARSWQFIGDTDRLDAAGKVVPCSILEGYLNEPIVLTCDAENQIHCLSNVCTHRGNLLALDECQTQQLRCGYHGRRFALDGKFVSTPGFENAVDFPSREDNLPKVPVGNWSKLLFAGIMPSVPLSDLIGEMQTRLQWLPLSDFKYAPQLSRDYTVEANWALYVENYLEGFHVPYVHPDLAVLLDTKSYRTELHDHCNVQIGIAQRAEDAFDLPPESPDFGQKIAAYYYWLFPNMMFNFYPWGLSVNVVVPLSPAKTRVRFLTYVWDESRIGSYSTDDIDKTEQEDEQVVQQVQKGVNSRFYKRGRYSPQWETGVHHFHTLLHNALEGTK
jgi:choline monooxygenase